MHRPLSVPVIFDVVCAESGKTGNIFMNAHDSTKDTQGGGEEPPELASSFLLNLRGTNPRRP